MARESLTIQSIVRTGLEPTYTAANADGHMFTNNQGGQRFVHVKNGDASPHTVTFPTPRTVHGLAVTDLAVAVPAGEERMIGPFPGSTFNQSDGTCHIDYDATTGMTIAVLTV